MKNLFLVLLILLIISQLIVGQVPQITSFQGLLTDPEGSVVADGDHSLNFKLYDAAANGKMLWEEVQTVPTVGGVFNVILGKVSELDLPFDKPYWLEMSIDGGEALLPRVEFTSSFYSLMTKSIEDSTISTAKLQNNAVTTEKLSDGSVTQEQLSGTVSIPPVGKAGGDLVGSYPKPSIANDAVNSAKVEDNSITEDDILPNVISSIDGVNNDGGNVDLVEGNNITITSNNVENTITISASTGSGGANKIDDLTDAKYDGSSLFLGYSAGTRDDGTTNNNTGVGIYALQANKTGEYNTAIGRRALSNNVDGIKNTAIGTNALNSNTVANYNTATGFNVLYYNTTGHDNTANGYYALFANTTASYNTATGSSALHENTEGHDNTANGYYALYSNHIGDYNTAIGSYALNSSRTGHYNTAIGYAALYSIVQEDYNTAIGYRALNLNKQSGQTAIGYKALASNIVGSYNTATGYQALSSNENGHYNTANGYNALSSNTTGHSNTANGFDALEHNTSGCSNTALGYWALSKSITSYYNTAIGDRALYNNVSGHKNTAVGSQALYNNQTGGMNTAVGYGCGTRLSYILQNTTALGYGAITTASNQVRIGNYSITSIGGYAGWSNLSDGRYKRNIREDVAGIDFIMGLRPITYNLDMDLLASKLQEDIVLNENGNRSQAQASPDVVASRSKKASIRNTGFIAQEVEELANKLGYDFSGVEVPENDESMYRLRYAEFVVPIVKAIQEQQELIEELRKEIDELKNR